MSAAPHEEPRPPGTTSRSTSTETDWTYLDGYYYYNRALAPGETTVPLFTTVTFAPEMGNEYQNSTAYVEVKVGAVQADNNGHGRVLRRRLAELCSAGARRRCRSRRRCRQPFREILKEVVK